MRFRNSFVITLANCLIVFLLCTLTAIKFCLHMRSLLRMPLKNCGQLLYWFILETPFPQGSHCCLTEDY